MSIKIASMNFGDCDTILHNTPNGMKNIAEVLGPNGEVYWSSTKELTGIPPLSIRSNCTMLLDYLISGNMSQSGTPTSSDPIQPQETGERTGNLAKYWKAAYVRADGTVTANQVNGLSFPVKIEIGETICFTNQKTNFGRGIAVFRAFDGSDLTDMIYRITGNLTYTAEEDCYIVIWGNYDNTTDMDEAVFNLCGQMLNLGSTALPYEPYGYKIPISSGGENLFDKESSNIINNKYMRYNGELDASANHIVSDFMPISGTYITISNTGVDNTTSHCFYDSNKNFISSFKLSEIPKTIEIPSNAKFIRCTVRKSRMNDFMLNLGSEPLPYEPYNRTTTPVYLGEVPTTRKIKKLVLTGEENWSISGSGDAARFYINIADAVGSSSLYCTHFTNGIQTTIGNCEITASKNLVFNNSEIATTTANWKTWLQQQYANGTPVTVWYVLATPETAVVNEPLRKIGDYADTVSYEQAGVQIPTNRGNTVIDVETTLKPSQMYIKYK